MDSNTTSSSGMPTPPPSDPIAGASSAGTASAGNGSSTGQFNIPQVVLEKHGELVELIKTTQSMSDDEREYWFQILPIMTQEQVDRLKTILQEEANQLSKLDDQYQDELSKLNKKHLEEWNVFQKKKERESLKSEEASHEAEEAEAEAKILKQLDEVTGEIPPNPQNPANPQA